MSKMDLGKEIEFNEEEVNTSAENKLALYDLVQHDAMKLIKKHGLIEAYISVANAKSNKGKDLILEQFLFDFIVFTELEKAGWKFDSKKEQWVKR
ncbi:MAG: hypothetical protein IJN95_05855 [Clostridia bacterium]|nr:hypothetical protein [Clostridia bacterium]